MSAELRRLERRVRRQVDVRMAGRRVWESLPAIVQILVAVAAAYAIAHWGLGHAVPLLAITVTINSLGFARDARPVRVAETVLGILLGIALGDALSLLVGRGLWQLVVVLAVVFVVGRAVSANPAFAVAAAVPSALVVMLPDPSGGPFSRSLDGLVGGVVALLVTALVPRDPRRAASRDGRALFSIFEESLASIVDGLADADPAAGELALTRLRRTQPLIDAWATTLDTAISVARISPWVHRHLPELRRGARVLRGADLAARHLRTIARRAEFLVRDGRVRPELAGALSQLATGVRLLGRELDDPELAGAARAEFTRLIGRLDPEELIPGAPVPDAAFLLLLRPLLVDLLEATGLDADDARALLPPIA
ncbi:FUSC family protein [Protaetiibacter larvae]|uniref:FUSC family protein n=1 Tax=Protaetiibacter larvae TaxID=2592654 RepID=A0A5C1Y8Y9_9MICO|nr:FUSC family protein [Protaetiibacter larvae]QEO09357.1 FUSC family protein [Protaetiibacter larvae]